MKYSGESTSSTSTTITMMEHNHHPNNNHYNQHPVKQQQKKNQQEQDQNEDNESTSTYSSNRWDEYTVTSTNTTLFAASVDVQHQQQQQQDAAFRILSLQPVSMTIIAAVLLLESPQHLDAAAVLTATATTTSAEITDATTTSRTATTTTNNKWNKRINWNATAAANTTTTKNRSTIKNLNNNNNNNNSTKSKYLSGTTTTTATTANTPCYKRATCNYVYLLPRSWVMNWICWAYNQSCTVEELPHKKPLFIELCKLLQLDTAMIMDYLNHNGNATTTNAYQYYQMHPPGPMDASPLSLMGHPLLLKPNIFFGKGTVPDSVTSTINSSISQTHPQHQNHHPQNQQQQQQQQQRGRSKTKQDSTNKIRRSSSLSGLSKLVIEAGVPKVSPISPAQQYYLNNKLPSTTVGCCAISESFYDYIKSIHGVRCNDFKTVSFQSSSSSSSSSTLGSSSTTSTITDIILHHHIKKQYNNNHNNTSTPNNSNNTTSPSLYLASAKKLLNATQMRKQNHYQQQQQQQQQKVEPKPIEFKRRVIHGIPDLFDSTVTRSIVEIYPIKILYTVLESSSAAGTNSMDASPNVKSNNYTTITSTTTTNTTTISNIKASFATTMNDRKTLKKDFEQKNTISEKTATNTITTATVDDNASNIISSPQSTPKSTTTQIKYMNILQTAATKLSYDKAASGTTTTESNTSAIDATTTVQQVSKLSIQIPESFSDSPSNGATNNALQLQQSSSSSPNFYDNNNNNVNYVSSTMTTSGFVLISRATPIDQAIKAILHVVASDKSADCKRCWVSYSFVNNNSNSNHGTTAAETKQQQQQKRTVRGFSSEYNNREVAEETVVPSSSTISSTPAAWKRNFTSAKEARNTLGTEFGDGYELWTDLFNARNHQQLSVEDFLQHYTTEDINMSPSTSIITTNMQQVKYNIIIETRHNSLKECYSRQHMELCNRIQVGDFVDAQDKCGKWYEAIVREVTEDLFKVHYIGWGSRWDSWIRRFDPCCYPPQYANLPGPPAPLWSRASRWRCKVKVGSDVEVREVASLAVRPKWFPAKIIALGRETDPIRSCEGGAQLEALEPDSDDPERLVPLLLLHRTRQVLVEVPKENFNSHVRAKLLPTTALLESDDPTPNPPYIRWVNLYGEEICNQYTHNAAPTSGVEEVAPATIRYDLEASRKPVEVLQTFNNVYGAGFVRESIRGVPPAPGSVGLHNLGNSCFLNSILQCLNHIEPLTQFFLSGAYKPDINKKNPLGSGGIVARTYAALLNDMWSGEYATLAPRMLKTTVAQFAPQFNNCHQHDSQEFCSFLMDGLHEDLNRVIDKPYIEEMEGRGLKDDVVAMESWRRHLLRHDSVIVDHCQGMHRSHLTCPDCGNESVKFDVFSTISLPIPDVEGKKTIPLSASLSSFTSVEELDEENAWYCSQCQKHVCAKKRITLWSTPDILILHLKRFTFNKCKKVEGRIVRSKVETKVEFPVDGLNMSPYMIGPIDKDFPPIYNLFGVSEHQGSTANSGHYTATVRNSRDGNWYRYNDSHVGRTSGDASITGGAYVLFYQRQKGKSRWAGMEKELLRKNRSSSSSNGIPASIDADGFQQVKSKKSRRKKAA